MGHIVQFLIINPHQWPLICILYKKDPYWALVAWRSCLSIYYMYMLVSSALLHLNFLVQLLIVNKRKDNITTLPCGTVVFFGKQPSPDLLHPSSFWCLATNKHSIFPYNNNNNKIKKHIFIFGLFCLCILKSCRLCLTKNAIV